MVISYSDSIFGELELWKYILHDRLRNYLDNLNNIYVHNSDTTMPELWIRNEKLITQHSGILL